MEHTAFRVGLMEVVRCLPGVMNVRATTAAQDLCAPSDAEVVVIDCTAAGWKAVRWCREAAGVGKRVVALTRRDDDDDALIPLMRAGARAVALRDGPTEEIIAAVRAAVARQAFLAPSLASHVMDSFVDSAAAEEAGVDLDGLTRREREVLSLVATGDSNRDIAARLTVTVRTVKYHVSNILMKLELRDRRQVMTLLQRTGSPQTR
ncbi:DNA-binding response regulator [Lentzea pudingi]|uniref:DNA-binding response regulator n=1 Tax=Lentzea pudingi TaxID=1789439 RepID=A0ABQ2HVR4_9PSEU|nr:response regulator transcription factor [Lentzea pudingi]GGM93037.1 DNA-binding response regulator [Lentzea pudingi]